MYLSPPVIWNTICFTLDFVIYTNRYLDIFLKTFFETQNEKKNNNIQPNIQEAYQNNFEEYQVPTGSIFSGGIHCRRTTWRCYQLCLSLLGNERGFFGSPFYPIGFGGNPGKKWYYKVINPFTTIYVSAIYYGLGYSPTFKVYYLPETHSSNILKMDVWNTMKFP